MDPAALLAFAARSAHEGEALWGALISLDGGPELQAAITAPRWVPEMVTGGEQVQGELVVRIRKAVLPEAPTLQTPLRWKRPAAGDWDPVVWRVVDPLGNDSDAVWTLKCEPLN